MDHAGLRPDPDRLALGDIRLAVDGNRQRLVRGSRAVDETGAAQLFHHIHRQRPFAGGIGFEMFGADAEVNRLAFGQTRAIDRA